MKQIYVQRTHISGNLREGSRRDSYMYAAHFQENRALDLHIKHRNSVSFDVRKRKVTASSQYFPRSHSVFIKADIQRKKGTIAYIYV